MADYESAEDAAEGVARSGIRRSSDPTGSIEHFTPKELREQAQAESADAAALQNHRGIRLTKLIPPGTG